MLLLLGPNFVLWVPETLYLMYFYHWLCQISFPGRCPIYYVDADVTFMCIIYYDYITSMGILDFKEVISHYNVVPAAHTTSGKKRSYYIELTYIDFQIMTLRYFGQ
jgi:hypothetical protein